MIFPRRCGIKLSLLTHLMFLPSQMNTSVESHSHDVISNFQPSLAVIVGFLAIIFFATFFLLFFSTFVRRNSEPNLSLVRSPSGVDRTVVESLPFFRFSALKGSRQGLECSVCLSTFDDLEILRLLPKCNHAFHINCVDKWLENHSTCPLCRSKVNRFDPLIVPYSASKRILRNLHDREPNMELRLHREESLRINIGSSFRKMIAGITSKSRGIQESSGTTIFHKHNHRIIASGSVLKNRWSSLSCPDMLLLNVEMLNDIASNRFCSCRIGEGDNVDTKQNLREELGVGRLLAPEVTETTSSSSIVRSVSDIVSCSRTARMDDERGNQEEEAVRRRWFHIVRRTAKWFANGQSTTDEDGVNN